MKKVFSNTSLHLNKMGSISKTVLTLMVLALLSTSINAAVNSGSTVTISSWDNEPFILEINQKRYQTNGSITLTNLEAGTSRMRMIRKGRNSHGQMNQNSGLARVLYNGTLTIPRNSRVRAEVDRNRRLRIIDVRRILLTQKPQRPNRPNRPQKPHRPSWADQNQQYHASDYEALDDSTYGEHYGFEPYSYEATGHYGGACAMSYSEFDQLVYSLNNACFSEDKLRIAKQALRHNLVTTVQLNELLQTLDFDSTRLELAKRAYSSIIDKERIWKVYDAFSFSSTAREFETFICKQ